MDEDPTPVCSSIFTVTLGQSDFADIQDMTWDQSGAFLLVGVTGRDFVFAGGVAVLAFSGSSLSQTVDPTGGGTTRILRAGSLVYGMNTCGTGCNGHPSGILGFAFQNGQLTPLPGSPHGNGGDMVIY